MKRYDSWGVRSIDRYSMRLGGVCSILPWLTWALDAEDRGRGGADYLL
jgi:hypothetical protein